MFNNQPHTSWTLNYFTCENQGKTNVLGHLPDTQLLAFDSLKQENYSVYDPFFSYSFALGSPHDSSCSEGTPVSDYFTSEPPTSPVSNDEDYLPKKKASHRMKRETQEEKIFACEFKECGKLFGRQEHVKRHVRSIHTKEKPYVCPYTRCQKKFARSDNLNQHIRTHRKTTKD